MSNALATTGVDGLEMVIAEAGISSWYDYYRENGLLVSPGGYPGEDLDTLTEFTYSRALLAGEYLRHQKDYEAYLKELSTAIDRTHGDYSQFWHDRNYVQFAEPLLSLHMVARIGMSNRLTSIKCSMLFQTLLKNTSSSTMVPTFT